ncbi:MAG: DUF2442 domain-containing protein [Bacteroidales bacterium]|nr:DUF2442 domain-containing protein [Bacteroidales bacterium]
MKRKLLDEVRLLSATYLHDYVIRFVFSDGKTNDIDFYPFLSKIPQNPMTSKYLDLNLFKNFKITLINDISWNDREMCYSFDTLYRGYIEKTTKRRLYDFSSVPLSSVAEPIEN